MSDEDGEILRAEYEAAVHTLRDAVDARRRAGQSAEEIARAAHAERRCLAEAFKQRTPTAFRDQLYRRSHETYGNPLGPTIEDLRAKGKTWEQIIESATRPGRVSVDRGRVVFSERPDRDGSDGHG